MFGYTLFGWLFCWRCFVRLFAFNYLLWLLVSCLFDCVCVGVGCLVLVCFISLVWFGGCGFVWGLVACCFVFGFTSILVWWFGVCFVCVV